MRYLLLTALLGIMYPFDSICNESPVATTHVNTLFSYPAGTFKAGDESVISPIVLVKGGSFTVKRITDGPGMITLDGLTGKISLRSSDPGIYQIIYNVNDQSETVRLLIQ